MKIVRVDLLDESPKVRHSPEKLARVIMACNEQACIRRASTAVTSLV
ncbi:MAG: hypothetical protein H0T92_12380 [Pyrinomonadaceae bacterium]|nr:hypothetical protein [Pyrinomonadaceae bacterium]